MPDRAAAHSEVSLQSAYRFTYSSNSHGELQSVCLGEATAETLELLEVALLSAPRNVPQHPFSLSGEPIRWGMTGKETEWIRCRFGDGRIADLSRYPKQRQWRVYGETRFQLVLPDTTLHLIQDPSSWMVSTDSPWDSPVIQGNDWLSRSVSFEGLDLTGSPMFGEQGRLLRLVSATSRITNNCPCSSEESRSPCAPLADGAVKGDSLRRLEDALHGWRKTTLFFYPDGTRRIPAWQQGPPCLEITCALEDGSVLILEFFSGEDAWCVQGEAGFRLYTDPFP